MTLTRIGFDELYRRFAQTAFQRAFRQLGDADEARDCVQSAFLALWERRETVLNAEAYINAMVTNYAASRHRSLSVRERFQRLQPIEDEAFDNQDEWAKDEHIAEFVETKLTESVRRVVQCVFYRRMSYREAAEQLSISVATVNKHVVTALRLMRQHFTQFNHNTLKP